MDKILLYVNILEFENFIKENTSGIKQISKIVETLNSQDNLKFQATILSNKILVFNKNEEDTKLAHTSSLVTYAQQLFHSLSAINLTSIGIITNGTGDFTEIKSTNLTPCTIQLSVNSNDFDSLLTLIEAYNDEIKIDGSVLFINKDLDSSTLSTMNCNDKYNIVLPPSSLGVKIPPSSIISLKEPLAFSDFFCRRKPFLDEDPFADDESPLFDNGPFEQEDQSLDYIKHSNYDNNDELPFEQDDRIPSNKKHFHDEDENVYGYFHDEDEERDKWDISLCVSESDITGGGMDFDTWFEIK